MRPYDVTELMAEAPADELRATCRDCERFMKLCRQCPGHGASWLCPPVSDDRSRRIASARRAVVVGRKIVPAAECALSGAQILQEVRVELERQLLELEKQLGGTACGLSGQCTYCSPLPCTRPHGEPCRHPELARPSLEAHGFDVAEISRRFLGTDIVWGRDGHHPAYYTLVGAVFY